MSSLRRRNQLRIRQEVAPDQHLTSAWEIGVLGDLIENLSRIRGAVLEYEKSRSGLLSGLGGELRASARNLLHYLSFRQHDVRNLQPSLAALGLSSLGRVERSVLYSLHSVLKVLHHLVHHSWSLPPGSEDILNRQDGAGLLARRTEALLGKRSGIRRTRILVTAPSEAAEHPALLAELLRSGMDCLRINCAHDGAAEWAKMILHLRTAQGELGLPCKILMDLGGPKIRTASLPSGPGVLKWKPERDCFGKVTRPARVWMTPERHPEPAPVGTDAVLPLNADFLEILAPGDTVKFTDTRQASRKLKVCSTAGRSRLAESFQTSYLRAGTILDAGKRGPLGVLGEIPGRAQSLLLKKGDRLRLLREGGEGATGLEIGCTLPEVFRDARPGEPLWLDDGSIGGVIRERDNDGLTVEITHARPGGSRLGGDKGINLPGTALSVPALTLKDREDLAFVARHADLVGYSFVQEPEDLQDLWGELRKHGDRQPGLVLKIETRRAFENLPRLLLAGLHAPSLGVMIARGDLAVEAGFQRLAELQEEILWICESAHVPVIWATQVLEHMAKDGLPSRAEVTDAAMGVRAEAVMLNKGPHIQETLGVLDEILRRMEGHQFKKTALLRPLKVADVPADPLWKGSAGLP